MRSMHTGRCTPATVRCTRWVARSKGVVVITNEELTAARAYGLR